MLCENTESSDWANGGDVICFDIAPKVVGIDISRFGGGGGGTRRDCGRGCVCPAAAACVGHRA